MDTPTKRVGLLIFMFGGLLIAAGIVRIAYSTDNIASVFQQIFEILGWPSDFHHAKEIEDWLIVGGMTVAFIGSLLSFFYEKTISRWLMWIKTGKFQ